MKGKDPGFIFRFLGRSTHRITGGWRPTSLLVRKSQTARYHPGNNVPCRYDGWIVGTWSRACFYKSGSESKAASPWETPVVKTWYSRPCIWTRAWIDRTGTVRGSEFSVWEAEPACRRQIQRECKGPSVRFDFLGPRKVRQKGGRAESYCD